MTNQQTITSQAKESQTGRKMEDLPPDEQTSLVQLGLDNEVFAHTLISATQRPLFLLARRRRPPEGAKGKSARATR